MKPIIGITCWTAENPRNGREHGLFSVAREYVDRIVAAGGAPILIPPDTDPEPIASILDGLVIPGGGDFDAEAWGEELHPESKPEYRGRTEMESRLIAAMNPHAPILGICYGCQLVNVLHGGSLFQHLPDVPGTENHSGDHVQTYHVDPNSKLGRIFGESARGKSWHHQAINRVGDGLRVVARHEDGTVEAIENDGERWFVGVQWHPERTELPESEALFKGFIEAVKASKLEGFTESSL